MLTEPLVTSHNWTGLICDGCKALVAGSSRGEVRSGKSEKIVAGRAMRPAWPAMAGAQLFQRYGGTDAVVGAVGPALLASEAQGLELAVDGRRGPKANGRSSL